MYDIRILVVEDETPLRKMISKYLLKEGYLVFEASNGKEGIEKWEDHSPDLIILDIMMPIMNGIEACQIIREKSQVPIILLTAKTQEEDKIIGFNVGANQYVEKPFGNKELVARVNSLLKIQGLTNSKSTYSINGIEIDKKASTVKVNDKFIELTFKEYDLLLYLMDNKDIVLSRENILDRIWGMDNFVDARGVDSLVKRLRKKLGDKSQCIVTIRGIGYKVNSRSTDGKEESI